MSDKAKGMYIRDDYAVDVYYQDMHILHNQYTHIRKGVK